MGEACRINYLHFIDGHVKCEDVIPRNENELRFYRGSLAGNDKNFNNGRSASTHLIERSFMCSEVHSTDCICDVD